MKIAIKRKFLGERTAVLYNYDDEGNVIGIRDKYQVLTYRYRCEPFPGEVLEYFHDIDLALWNYMDEDTQKLELASADQIATEAVAMKIKERLE